MTELAEVYKKQLEEIKDKLRATAWDKMELEKRNKVLQEENQRLLTQNKDLIHEIKHLTFHESFFNSH